MMVWVDLETTGLDPVIDHILEVGIEITDDDLNFVERYALQVKAPPLALLAMDQWCKTTHTDNGLLSTMGMAWSLKAAEDKLIETMDTFFAEPPKPPICGSSVHFDRAFLTAHMPRFMARFSHRNIDCSSVKELAARWSPHLDGHIDRPTAMAQHRALPDLADTIAEAKFYKDHIFNRR